MGDQSLTLFVSKGKDSYEANKILRMAGLGISVVPHSPYKVGPELQIGPSSNDRIRGLEKIKKWLDS